ncbi:MAG: thioredoxin family protein [Paracoccaceae bacterium]
MARKTNKTRRKKPAESAAPLPSPTRRSFLVLTRNFAIGAAGVGGIGYWAANSFAAHAAEHDLSRVGQGKPSVVQIHDPTCPTCTALQKETRQALEQFGECDMLYLVADIKQSEGSSFAGRYGVPHVTLLLFDADGALTETLRGMRHSDELAQTFAQHFRKHAPKA